MQWNIIQSLKRKYKKDLHDPDNHDGMITQSQKSWNVKSRTITMNKVNGGDGITIELFQILRDDAVKVLHSIC